MRALKWPVRAQPPHCPPYIGVLIGESAVIRRKGKWHAKVQDFSRRPAVLPTVKKQLGNLIFRVTLIRYTLLIYVTQVSARRIQDVSDGDFRE